MITQVFLPLRISVGEAPLIHAASCEIERSHLERRISLQAYEKKIKTGGPKFLYSRLRRNMSAPMMGAFS